MIQLKINGKRSIIKTRTRFKSKTLRIFTQQISAVAMCIEKKITDKMAVIEQSQQNLRTGIDATQSNTQKLTGDMPRVMDETKDRNAHNRHANLAESD